MAQYSFLIQHTSSVVCNFRKYLVDIGDEQSIERNLSFSGHMKRISGIWSQPGHGTADPAGGGRAAPPGGAALAINVWATAPLGRQSADGFTTTPK